MSAPGFRQLSDVVRELQQGLVADLDALEALKMEAVVLAVSHFGEATVASAPALLDLAALAIALRPRPGLIQVRPGAARLVHATDLHSLPADPPVLLHRHAVLLEVRRPETGERLFDDTVSLGAYQLDGEWWLIGLRYPQGVAVSKWVPRWQGGDLDAGVPAETSPLIEDVDGHREWAIEATRFLVVLGLLLDAEGAPLCEETNRPERQGGGSDASAPGGWTVRRLSLDPERASGGSGQGGGQPSPDERQVFDVPVRGHLKRQRRGPGRSEAKKWIYVEGDETRRWVGPRSQLAVLH